MTAGTTIAQLDGAFEVTGMDEATQALAQTDLRRRILRAAVERLLHHCAPTLCQGATAQGGGGECNAQTGDRVEAEPDWDSVAPPVPDYDVDRRACKLRVPMRLNFLSADYGELRGQLMAYTEVVGDNPPRHISRIGLESLKNNERTRLYLAGSYCF